MKIAIVLGTRPEIIKMSPVIRELEERGGDYFIVHTGQHYSYNLDGTFFKQLNLPGARHNLEVGSGTHTEQTAKILVAVERVLNNERPDVVLVQGDTNSVLGGALAAVKIHVKIGHIEAGLRSYDRRMPEEINRVLVDHCSDYCFVPTEQSRANLLREAVRDEAIFVTGNTIVDAVRQNVAIADTASDLLSTLNLRPDGYFLVTLHRQENVDDPTRFALILEGLSALHEKYSVPLIYPIHPRSRKRLQEFGLTARGIELIEPVGFLGFLQLEKNARLILTDSGGVQEEACILRTRCVTLRDNTERPETVDAGANLLAGAEPERIISSAEAMLGRDTAWPNPFGDGRAGKRIIDTVEARL